MSNPVEPDHYTKMTISPLEYINANDISWNAANAIKYISRYKMKNGVEDLMKAKWYLDDLIERELEKEIQDELRQTDLTIR